MLIIRSSFFGTVAKEFGPADNVVMLKTIHVVAALIEQGGKVFAAKRAYGFLKGHYEFPGGKVESGETGEEAIVREIKEELDTIIEVDGFFMNVEYDYPEFHLNMDVYRCRVISGRLEVNPNIHGEEAFLMKDKLLEEDWCPADRLVAEAIVNGRGR